MRIDVARRSWPIGPVDLLLQAGLAPEAQARRAWAKWSGDSRDIARVSHTEARLLAAFSDRIAKLDPDSPLRKAINGVTKHLWTESRLAITHAVDAFDRLSEAGIPFLIFKGGALLAERLANSGRRVIGDVDILVPRESIEAAIDALVAAGWDSINGESPAYLRRLAQVRISGNYRKGQHGKIDLHISPFHFAKTDDSLDQALWRDARAVTLAGRSILVPDSANAIVISLAHAPMSPAAEWALDVVTRTATQPIDWDRLTHIANQRGLAVSCVAGLRYLRERLSIEIPVSALAALGSAPVTIGDWLKYWSNVADRGERSLVAKAANRLADRILGRQHYSRFVKDRVEVSVTRPSLPFARRRLRPQDLCKGSADLAIRHKLTATGHVLGRHVVVGFAIPRTPVSRRVFFDVSANGTAIARLRCRLRPRTRKEKTVTFSFSIPPSSSDTEICIEARPTQFLPPDAGEALRVELGAVQFRLVSAAIG